jgi:hypothetical protein
MNIYIVFVIDIYLFGRKRKEDRLLEIFFLKIFSWFLLLQEDLAPPVAIMHKFAAGPEFWKNFEKIISLKDRCL